MNEYDGLSPADPEPARRSRDRVLWWLIPLGAAVIAGAFVVGVMLGTPPTHIRVVRTAAPQFPPLPAMRLTAGSPARPEPPPTYRPPVPDTNIQIAPDPDVQIAQGADGGHMNRPQARALLRPAPLPPPRALPGGDLPSAPDLPAESRSDDIAAGGRSEPDSPALFDRPREPAPPAASIPDAIESRPRPSRRVDAVERTAPSARSLGRRGPHRPAPPDAETRRRYRKFFDENDFQDER